mgnify:CR=1 FL=1
MSAAYHVLSDPTRRAEHDRDLAQRSAVERVSLASTLAVVQALTNAGRIAEAIALFLTVPDEESVGTVPLQSMAELACTMLAASAHAAHGSPAAHSQITELWRWLRRTDQVDSIACNAWFAHCLRRGHHQEAMRAYRLSVEVGLEQV